MKLKIDIHEPPKVAKYIQDAGVETEVVLLPIGDIVCEEKSIIIERKEYGDLVNSIKSQHLTKQLLQMCEACEYPVLLISGSFQELHFGGTQWTSEQNTGAIASLIARHPKLKMAFLPNDKQLCECAIKICEKVNDGKILNINDTELMKNHMKTDDYVVKIYSCVPGIGIKTAQDIATKYPTLKQLIEANEEDLLSIPRIGKVLAKSIKEIFK